MHEENYLCSTNRCHTLWGFKKSKFNEKCICGGML